MPGAMAVVPNKAQFFTNNRQLLNYFEQADFKPATYKVIFICFAQLVLIESALRHIDTL